MQAYGRKKHHTLVAGHQRCGTCHPVQKNKTTRGRRENQSEVEQQVEETDAMKLYTVFEIFDYWDDEQASEEEIRLFHCTFSTRQKADEYVEKLESLEENEGINFEVEEHELDKPKY